MIMIHLPHVHLLLEEVCKLLFPLCAIILTTAATTAAALFIKPARCDISVSLQVHHHYFMLQTKWDKCH